MHDALLIEGPGNDIQTVVIKTQRAMREASEILLGGFSLRTDSEIVTFPDRYTDERGTRMWEVVKSILDELKDKTGDDLSNRLPTT
ncbi:MAG: hypothetical protein IH899_16490 [Planctomycetes bacterium]|nr:hypothetical protein [Planctomycetota bacterium]